MRTPWHIWVIGVVALLWNAGSAFDYLMIKTGNPEYLAQMTPDQLTYLVDAPIWFHAGWGLGVWAAIAGAVLILLRSRYAVTAFWAALAGMIVAGVYTLFIADPSGIAANGTGVIILTSLIVVIQVILIFYARIMADRGHLR